MPRDHRMCKHVLLARHGRFTGGTMGPLDGINVLDLGGVLSVPYAATMLAELGADVIKVESRDGDQLRGNHPIHCGMSAMYYNA
ncbi:MAG: CoA transferase, partial [Pseudonocardiaceae bacterium]